MLIILLHGILLSTGSSLHLIEFSCIQVPHFTEIKVLHVLKLLENMFYTVLY